MEEIHIITKRLVIMTGVVVALIAAIFGITFLTGTERLMITYLAFTCGIIGGFASIQQRLKRVSDEELNLLCGSWFQLTLIPVFGGVFVLVLYTIFVAGIMSGHMFRLFEMPEPPVTGADTECIARVLRETYPKTGQDLAKMAFWSFVAGFSERFVPQIVTKVTPDESNQ